MGKSLTGKELGCGITQRKDGLYQARYTDRFGSRKTLYAKTITEIRKKLGDAKYENEHGLNVNSSNVTLDEWYDIWRTTLKTHCRNTTLATYNTTYNIIKEELGYYRLDQLTLIVIQNALNKLSSDSKRRRVRSLLIDMLSAACDMDIIRKNQALCTKIDRSDEPIKEKEIMSYEEEDALEAVLDKDSTLYSLIHVLLGTGMRIGEALGLMWDDVNFDDNLLSVNRTLVHFRRDGKRIYEFHKPKTKSGTRLIPMTADVKEELVHQKERKAKIESKHAAEDRFKSLIFVSRSNRPLSETNIDNSLYAYEQKAQIPRRSLHSLRHTFASRCVAKGMNPKVLQKILGHGSFDVTMDTYCHVGHDELVEEMQKLV